MNVNKYFLKLSNKEVSELIDNVSLTDHLGHKDYNKY